VALVAAALSIAGACAKKTPPIARPAPPPPATTGTTAVPRPPAPPEPVVEMPPIVEQEPFAEERSLDAKTLDELNKESPLRPVFYDFDSFEVNSAGRAVLEANAELLRRYQTWVITVEGHCDERGTAEYNLALGERRALSSRNYLVSLGIAASRLRTVSYGKEFPFDPGQTEEAYARNRRAHFVITSK
jgi:peptidoglycan-associated lipoprotein